MKPKIKIPKKKDFTDEFIVSLFFVGNFISSLDEIYRLRWTQQIILSMMIFPFVVIILYYRNRYRYYAPKFRTCNVISTEQLQYYAGPKIFFTIHKFDRENFVLQGKDGEEVFYLALQLNEKISSDLAAFIVNLEAGHGTILAVSFILNYSKEESGPDGPQSVSMKLWSNIDTVDIFYLGSLVSDNPFDSYLKS